MSSVSYVWWRGGRFHQSDIASLEMAEEVSGVKIIVTQGGYNRGGVAASAGTHDGGSVIDIQIKHLSASDQNKLVKFLRLCGWAAWIRRPSQGFVLHIHAVRCGSGYASYGARQQVVQYKNRQNGLANRRADTEPWQGYYTWDTSKYNPKNKKETIQQLLKRMPLEVVRVYWVNQARSKKNLSRHVYYIQIWLAELGYYKSPCDGKWGPVTQAAYNAFRKKNKMTATGAIGIKSASLLKKQYEEKTKSKTLPLKEK